MKSLHKLLADAPLTLFRFSVGLPVLTRTYLALIVTGSGV